MSTAGQNELVRFRCECGAVLAAPAKMAGRNGKCKKCGRVQPIPQLSEAQLGEDPPEGAIGIQEICGVCQTALEDDDERTTCDACSLPFHEECWRENLGCSAYGCANVNALKQGPDIRVGQFPQAPAATSTRLRLSPPQPKADDNEIPWDHILLAGGALATVAGFLTCGLPTLVVGGLAIWRIVLNRRKMKPVGLPALTLVMCVLGFLLGLCLSGAFWTQ
jgi:hypothetical protein